MAGATVEFFLEWYFLRGLKKFTWVNWIGLLIVLLAQFLRTAAMVTAGSNFSHIIADEKEHSHQLVTTGIYSIFRHPSYTGFFYWAFALQIVLMNPLCLVAYFFALKMFFSGRIEYEEGTLLEFFGEEYRVYRERTWVLIPFLGS
ncbi:hypothetical protein HDV00_006152 [Rhizophlyctis rosea]|nr:hypothetical protein HDV00_006152 [Rhizophlyctis rosea]